MKKIAKACLKSTKLVARYGSTYRAAHMVAGHLEFSFRPRLSCSHCLRVVATALKQTNREIENASSFW